MNGLGGIPGMGSGVSIASVVLLFLAFFLRCVGGPNWAHVLDSPNRAFRFERAF
jgi:hypothetical protein